MAVEEINKELPWAYFNGVVQGKSHLCGAFQVFFTFQVLTLSNS